MTTKQKLLAIAALLLTAGGGAVFVTWGEPIEITEAPAYYGNLEVVDRSQCTVSACSTAQCTTALAILADGGVTDATMRLVECPVRLGAQARAQAVAAGMALAVGSDGGISRYQQVQFVAMRRAGSLAIAVDDAGWPVHAVTTVSYPCAWKPTAGASCTRIDGGLPGTQNTMQAGEWTGAGCTRKACVEYAGTSSAP